MFINIFQVIFFALLQGTTELFPISSLGHTVIAAAILGWNNVIQNDNFVSFVVALHLGTTIALIIYFYKDWIELISNIFKNLKDGEVKYNSKEWVSWLIIIGSIPAGLIGVFLEKPIKNLFKSPWIAALFLTINGFILLGGEMIRKRNIKMANTENIETKSRELKSLKWYEAVLVGLAQSLALIPGISRSGTTMVSGLVLGLNHEDAAKYSFLLGTPIIGAAAILEIPQLFSANDLNLFIIVFGSILSGITAYLTTKFLMKYFKEGTLKPFAFYCIVAGILSLLFIVR